MMSILLSLCALFIACSFGNVFMIIISLIAFVHVTNVHYNTKKEKDRG